ncbi:MAG: hypothetical protein LBB56_02745 [Chitinispirillales bacterium]|jgi:hypothetical protein|nr:hypothetical protein [Chitinispirillales bacterium]
MISEQQKNSFYEIIKRIIQDALPKIQKLLDDRKYISSHHDYPISVSITEGQWPSTNTTNLLSGLHNNNYANYSSAFTDRKSDNEILVTDLLGYDELLNFLNQNEEFKTRLNYVKYPDDVVEFMWLIIIGDIVERYISKHKKTDFNEDGFKTVFHEVLNIYLLEKLEYDICVPILMLEFEDDIIELSENFSIEKMTKDFIRSKHFIGNYDSRFERIVLDCATHMFVIKGYHYNPHHDGNSLIRFAYRDIYPLDVINKLFACIRIVTKFPTGYAQIIARPLNNWICLHCQGDLMGVTGAKVEEYPPSFKEHYWLEPHNRINTLTGNKIKNLFSQLGDDKRLKLAIGRLNRSALRNNEEDTILDVVIGLELLLSDNNKSELTYKFSSRMAAISTLYDNFPFSPNNVKEHITKIYGYRSNVVHSGEAKPATKIIQLSESAAIETIELAIDYLKFAIEILAKNPKYLESQKIDELIMNKLENKIV